MNKIYLLLSFILFLVIISMSYSASEVKSYVDGNVMLRVYTNDDGEIFKRIYYVDGVKNRMVEYVTDYYKVETYYNVKGNKEEVIKYLNGEVFDITNYTKGLYTSKSESLIYSKGESDSLSPFYL